MPAQDLEQLVHQLVVEPLFLVESELGGDSKGRVLRVVVDTDAGVTVDQLAALNRSLSRALDEGELISGHYRLEVCSPGLDRALRHPRVLARAVGRRVRVRLHPAGEPQGPLELVGRLVASSEVGVEMDVDGQTQAYGWERIQAVHHALEW